MLRTFTLTPASLLALGLLSAVVVPPSGAAAERFVLLTGADALHYPGQSRTVVPVPGPGVPGAFFDGDRLAGTSDTGPVVQYQGINGQDLLFQPNEFGSLSFLFRRGSVPLGPPGVLPFLGIEFLGGPRLDLDGDLGNGVRTLIPVQGQDPALLPGIQSFIELDFDTAGGVVTLANLDSSGSNEGGPGVGPEIATIVVTLAGSQSDGAPGDPVNPAVDTRSGALAPFDGAGGLVGVYRIDALGCELWEDTILYSPSTLPLGTLQYLGVARGWMIERDAVSGAFPGLAGQGLGSTLWPLVDASAVGQSFNTSTGGSAVIAGGLGGDTYTAANNGGLALTDNAGDLGAYLDQVVFPLVPANAHRVVYLEWAGWGINNSFDPVFGDTIAYDAVIVAAASCPGDTDGDGAIAQDDLGVLLAAFGTSAGDPNFNAGADFNYDGVIDQADLGILLAAYGTSCR